MNIKEYIQATDFVVNNKMLKIGLLPFLVIMLISLISAFFISFLYMKFYESRATGSHIHRAFPLLGISVTAIFITIQFSLPLSLGLLGALSIVRFRTPVKEPEEIGFIMLVIASSLCCATFNIVFLSIILGIALLGLICSAAGKRVFKGRKNDGMIVVNLPAGNDQLSQMVLKAIAGKIDKGRLDSLVKNNELEIISYSFIRFSEDDFFELKSEIMKISKQAEMNIFFNRSGEI